MNPTNQEPLAYRLPAAARAIGVSARTLQALTARGEIPAVRVGRRCTLYRVADLQAWLAMKAGEVRP